MAIRTRKELTPHRNGTPPWEIGRPQPVFVRLPDQGAILDSGCGTGENALFLASRGLEVVGVDFSLAAIGMGPEKEAARALAATFMVRDALALDELGAEDLRIGSGGMSGLAVLSCWLRRAPRVPCAGMSNAPH